MAMMAPGHRRSQRRWPPLGAPRCSPWLIYLPSAPEMRRRLTPRPRLAPAPPAEERRARRQGAAVVLRWSPGTPACSPAKCRTSTTRCSSLTPWRKSCLRRSFSTPTCVADGPSASSRSSGWSKTRWPPAMCSFWRGRRRWAARVRRCAFHQPLPWRMPCPRFETPATAGRRWRNLPRGCASTAK